jgi:Putative exonuclease SbcCD, C subunit/P-loop containing region of AAA domain
MRIAQATTLNWGGLPNRDYPIGAYTLFAGETGSGKTSLIDAVVAVMAGGDSRKSKFNTAQTQPGQSSKKSRRTLASYVTGSDGMGGYLRPTGAHAYAGVAWAQDEHDGTYGTPFTAIIGAEAALDRETERTATLTGDLTRILVRGHVIGQADLLSATGTVLPGADLLVALRSKYGTAAVRDFRTGAEYLAMLYAYLKGDTTPVSREETESAIKAFVSAIAYRQPDDIDGLIREEILDVVDNENLIQRLMETIREVNRLKNEAARMEANIVQLEGAEGALRAAFEAFMDERMFRALVDIRETDDVRERLAERSATRDQHGAELAETERTIAAHKEVQEAREAQHAELQKRINSSDIYATKKNFENLIDEQERAMAAILARVDSARAAFGKAARDLAFMDSVVGAVPELAEQRAAVETLRNAFARVSLPALEAAIQAVRDGLGEPPLAIMAESCAALLASLTEAWDTAVNGDAGLRSAFNRAFRDADQAFQDAAKEAGDIRRRVDKLKVGQIEYPDAVERFLAVLRDQLPQCAPRVLCDVVEVSKPEWQPAIEGYLGRDRFTILYDRTFETQVVALAKAFRRDHAGARGDISVPQLSLAIDDRPRLEAESIVHLLAVSSDAEASGYLKARYGRTLVVHDTAALKSTRSGIMQDGWSTQGYRYQQRRYAEEDMVFGAEIRRRQRERLIERGQALAKEIEALEGRKSTLDKASAVPTPATVTLSVNDTRAFSDAADLKRMAAEELAGLDLSSVAGLIAEAKTLQSEIKTLIKEIEGLILRKGGLGKLVEGLAIEIRALETQLAELAPKAEAAEIAFRSLMQRAFLDRDEWPKRFADEIQARRPVASYERRAGERTTLVTNGINDAVSKLVEYNRAALDFQQLQLLPFAYDPRLSADTVLVWMEDVWRKMREQVRTQKDTGLPERRLQCDMAERSFTSSFTTDFCATVLSNVEGRDDTIIALNANLDRINFGGDTFHLISAPKPEYADYIELFRKIRSLTETRQADLDLFNSGAFAPTERDTLLRIRDLLLDERDTENALIELRRIADYRNYRAYDFERRRGGHAVALSRWGTGSGGESETPIYVIRVAVMASAFKIFSQQKKAHFRSIFMDEVFATMDEARTRRVLGFLKELGLQIVCAAPTRSMAAVLDEFDTRINFSKYKSPAGDRSDVNVIRLDSERVRALYDAHRDAVSADAAARFEKEDPPLRVVSETARAGQSGGS